MNKFVFPTFAYNKMSLNLNTSQQQLRNKIVKEKQDFELNFQVHGQVNQ